MSNLDRLIRFAVVAKEMSFSKAARRLNVDQPWLSRQIQQLEAQLGFALFVRSTRRVSLTGRFIDCEGHPEPPIDRVRKSKGAARPVEGWTPR